MHRYRPPEAAATNCHRSTLGPVLMRLRAAVVSGLGGLVGVVHDGILDCDELCRVCLASDADECVAGSAVVARNVDREQTAQITADSATPTSSHPASNRPCASAHNVRRREHRTLRPPSRSAPIAGDLLGILGIRSVEDSDTSCDESSVGSADEVDTRCARSLCCWCAGGAKCHQM